MLIELSNFSDKLRQYRLILEKLTAEQPNYERRREKLSANQSPAVTLFEVDVVNSRRCKITQNITLQIRCVGLNVGMLPGDLLLPGSTMKLTPGVGMTLLIGIAGSIFLVTQSHRLLRR
uniref:Uncharacterized protein n=1 Tax=Anopheles culicifacies TaxID=139723 RepID=A0A182ME28_9DIPT